jgi:hypothetical protein
LSEISSLFIEHSPTDSISGLSLSSFSSWSPIS